MKAFLYPGQGSQSVGMGKFLVENFKLAESTFEEASDAISQDITKLCFESNNEVLSLTENTQPAILTVSVATTRVLMNSFGVKPQITAGHSIGEYASLVLGKSLSFTDAVKSVRARGKAMQSAVPIGQGGMTACLGLNEEQVQFLCKWTIQNSGHSPLSPANYNCEGQIVISGNQKALDWLKQNFKSEILPGEAKRAKLIPLQVSAPFHCAMMMPAQETMKIFLSDISFSNSEIPIIQNVNAELETEAIRIKSNLIEQISAPVLWTQSIHKLKTAGARACFEVGHGQVLKGLLKKIDSEYFQVYSCNSLEDFKLIESLSI